MLVGSAEGMVVVNEEEGKDVWWLYMEEEMVMVREDCLGDPFG